MHELYKYMTLLHSVLLPKLSNCERRSGDFRAYSPEIGAKWWWRVTL